MFSCKAYHGRVTQDKVVRCIFIAGIHHGRRYRCGCQRYIILLRVFCRCHVCDDEGQLIAERTHLDENRVQRQIKMLFF